MEACKFCGCKRYRCKACGKNQTEVDDRVKYSGEERRQAWVLYFGGN